MDIPKHIKSQLRELANQAYEHELADELANLASRFDEWRAGKITVWDLTELVHKYHNGPARELYKRYHNLPHSTPIAHAVARGILTMRTIPDSIWPYVEKETQFLQSKMENDTDK